MRLIRTTFGATLVLVAAFSFALGQAEREKQAQDTSPNRATTNAGEPEETTKANTTSIQDEPQIWVHLFGGRRMQVDEVTESTDGIWFKRGNVSTFVDRERVERIERGPHPKLASDPETLEGSGKWRISDSAKVESFFLAKFGRPLPLSAFGQSDLHTRWGYDHRQGMDIGLHPDSPEGRGLIEFLRTEEIPHLVFREAVPGVATGPHIHVGNRSRRLPRR